MEKMIYKQIAEVVLEMKKYGRPQKEITKYIEVATSDPRANILDMRKDIDRLSNDTLNSLLW